MLIKLGGAKVLALAASAVHKKEHEMHHRALNYFLSFFVLNLQWRLNICLLLRLSSYLFVNLIIAQYDF